MEEKDEKKNIAHQGKGKKKNKKQTIDLSEFLSNDSTPAGFSAVPSSRCNWADLMNDEDTDDYSPSWNKKNENNVVILPNAPKAIRGPDIDLSLVSTSPPFYCYLNNLPYEATTNDVQKFFGKLKVFNIEFIKENAGGRMRNYVRVDFEDRDSLIDGLAKNQSLMKNRYIKVTINSPENERENYRKEREREKERDTTDRDDRTSGDWRARKPEDKSVGQFSFLNRSYNNSSYFNRNRGDYNSRNNDQNSYNNRVSRDREQEKYPEHLAQSNNNRKAYLNNFLRSISPVAVPSATSSDQTNEEKDVQTRPKLHLTKALDYLQERHQDDLSESKFNENDETSFKDKELSNKASVPTVRKKLVLLPPSKKENVESQEHKINSSIFGDAKPVDTTKRLLEIDEKTKQNEKELEKMVIDIKTVKKDNRDWGDYSSARYKRGSDSGSQAGSSFRENFDGRDRFDRGEERINKFDDWSYRNRNNDDNINNRDRRGTPTNRNYNNNNYNRDIRDNNSTRRYNGSNNNGNRNWNSENLDQQYVKKNYDEHTSNRDNSFRLNNRLNNKPRNDGNYSMNKFDLLKEGEMA